MNSFISNFRKEFKVLLVALAVVLAAEVAIRLLRLHLSADVVHLEQIPAIASRLSEAKGVKVLFLGNSLTRRGVSVDVVESELHAHPGAVSFERVFPDDTAIFDWYYIFRTYFNGERAPDYVVVGFAENQLSDSTPVRPERVAAYYGGWNTMHEVFATDLVAFAPRVDFVLSNFLVSYSEKDRIRNRLLALAVPDYRDTAQRFNSVVVRGSRLAVRTETYSRLERFLRLCDRRRVHVIAVAMPLPQSYPIPSEIPALLDHHGAVLVDLRQVTGINANEFADGYHLNPEGAQIYSHALAVRLGGILPLNGSHGPVLTAVSLHQTGSEQPKPQVP